MEQFAFHHLGVAVNNMDRSIDSYKRLFGYGLVLGPFDDPIHKVRVSFLSRGSADATIELVAPFGPDSPIDGILKRGGGTYHLCYMVPDMSAAAAHLVKSGSILIRRPVPAVAFDLRPIAWFRTPDGLLVELVQR